MNVKAINECVPPLAALGFTELEAMVYAYLVQESPATGYRIAQAIDKPFANTYKATGSLQRKGAVIADQSGSKLCRAVPPDELLARIHNGFTRQQRMASDALARLRPAETDDGVYSMTSREQVFERCRSMLSRAKQVVLLDVFPTPLEALRSDIEATAKRGATVAVQVYQPATLVHAEAVLAYADDTSQWPVDWLNIVIDGSELMMAFLPTDGEHVHQAIWSHSPFLCLAYHGALTKEMLTGRYRAAIHECSDLDQLRETVARFPLVWAHESPGYETLASRLSWAEQETSSAGQSTPV